MNYRTTTTAPNKTYDYSNYIGYSSLESNIQYVYQKTYTDTAQAARCVRAVA